VRISNHVQNGESLAQERKWHSSVRRSAELSRCRVGGAPHFAFSFPFLQHAGISVTVNLHASTVSRHVWADALNQD
jgi:hypothetical protein